MKNHKREYNMFGLEAIGSVIMAAFRAGERAGESREVFDISDLAITLANAVIFNGDIVISTTTGECAVVLETKPRTEPVYGDDRPYIYVESFDGSSTDYWLLEDTVPLGCAFELDPIF